MRSVRITIEDGASRGSQGCETALKAEGCDGAEPYGTGKPGKNLPVRALLINGRGMSIEFSAMGL